MSIDDLWFELWIGNYEAYMHSNRVIICDYADSKLLNEKKKNKKEKTLRAQCY